MRQEIGQHLIEYVALASYTLLSIVLFMGYRGHDQRYLILFMFILYYLAWSVLHHLSIRKMSLRIVLEYLLIAAFGVLALKVFF